MSTSRDDQVLTEIDGPVITITFNRPDHRNAVSGVMMKAFSDAIREGEDADCVVLHVRATGEDFCIGRDHTESPRVGATTWTKEEWRGFTKDAFATFGAFTGVSVVEVQGRAYGFGAALAVASDVAIASEDARLSFDEVPMGFAPRRVMSRLYNRLGERRIKELVLTGRSVAARDAFCIGMVTEVVPSHALASHTIERVTSLVTHDPRVVKHAKTYLNELTKMPSPDRPDYEGPSTF